MRYRIYSCASSCCHNRKLFEIPIQFHLVKDCITRLPFPYTCSLHLLNSVPRREHESRQFANILLAQIYVRREQKTQNTSQEDTSQILDKICRWNHASWWSQGLSDMLLESTHCTKCRSMTFSSPQ
jgi:hypothetical protein